MDVVVAVAQPVAGGAGQVFGVQSPLVSGFAAFVAPRCGRVTAGLAGGVPAQRMLVVSVALFAGGMPSARCRS